ncbi:hypothetical protein [Athalassotoga saccharophila]|uniref:Uncharacterized protein n=1 Tax=Athalassotoga saccharophila TaxID=1441386 RepID=A0A6N4TE51_9BACT|nr:hypothetical protein [Athalassotoga saccharophila]BBJ29059.1 hypothetical protein ATHSA_p10012 [Athalassotoga saccharophila]
MNLDDFVSLIPSESVMARIITFKGHLPEKLEQFRQSVIKFVESIPADRMNDVKTYLGSGEALINGNHLNTPKVISYLLPMSSFDGYGILRDFSYYSHQFTSYMSKLKADMDDGNKSRAQSAAGASAVALKSNNEIQTGSDIVNVSVVTSIRDDQKQLVEIDTVRKDDSAGNAVIQKDLNTIEEDGKAMVPSATPDIKEAGPELKKAVNEKTDEVKKVPSAMTKSSIVPGPSKIQYATEDELKYIMDEKIDNGRKNSKKENTSWFTGLVILGLFLALCAIIDLLKSINSQSSRPVQPVLQPAQIQPARPVQPLNAVNPVQQMQPKMQPKSQAYNPVSQQATGTPRDINEFSRQLMEQVHKEQNSPVIGNIEYDEFGNPLLTAGQMAKIVRF